MMPNARLILGLLLFWLVALCPPAAAETLPAPTQLGPLLQKCAAGSAASCYDLGRLQRDSADNQIKDPQAAGRAFKTACDLKFMQACNDLGDLYANGEGVEQYASVALYLYERACTAGNPQACYSVADWTSDDAADAVRQRSAALFEWSCNAGYLDACARSADDRLTKSGAEVAGARALLEDICAKGNEQACLFLGHRLIWGNVLQKDVPAGIAAFKTGCTTGGGEACLQLGDVFQNGNDVPKDAEQAASAYRLSCQRQNLGGCEGFARAQYLGDGLASDKVAALAQFEALCAKDETRCRSSIAIRQVTVFQHDCAAGNMQRCFDLAEKLSEPGLLLEDRGRASTLFQQACDGDVAAACLAAGRANLAIAQMQDRPHIEAALNLIEKGCSLGSSAACHTLADSFESGRDGISDTLRAAKFFARACDLSDKAACAKMDQYAELIPDHPLGAADADYKPPVDPAQDDRADKAPSCVTEEIVFDGRVFTRERCKKPVRVMRGFDIAPGSAPWQALIERPAALDGMQLSATSRVLCGGSLIEQGWVLTAAHCLYGDKKDLVSAGYRIRLGLHKISNPEGLSYPIRRIIQHPEFRNGDKTLANDIALIQYDVAAGQRLGPSVGMRKIRVDTKPVGQRQIYEGMTAYAYGWGWTEATNSAASTTLRGGKLALRTEAECNALTRFMGRLSNVVLCASGPTGDQACYGDSGGPLVYYGEDDGAPTLIGVISSGKRCGTLGEPSRYTRVAKALDWIRPIVWPSATSAARR